MRKIKLTTLMAGPDGVKEAGFIGDFGSQNEALVNGGFAEWVKEAIEMEPIESVKHIDPVIETASFKPAENAMKHKPQIKKKGGR